MSEFSRNQASRADQLVGYVIGLIEGRKGTGLLEQYKVLETDFRPGDILILFDNLFEKKYPMEGIKSASNKLFNILFKTLSPYRRNDYPRNSFLWILQKDNAGIKKILGKARNDIKKINSDADLLALSRLEATFRGAEKFLEHYVVMENIVFPEIEKQWKNHQCLKLMWSFHDDIRRNLHATCEILRAAPFNLKQFNETVSKVYFNISTIVFREEHVLFPILHESFGDELFVKMGDQLREFDLAYADVRKIKASGQMPEERSFTGDMVRLATGELTPDQIDLIFNHLPVDITFVDENNRVKYFSSPKHRIFPRTASVINRRVQDCHPHESVHIVNKIVDSFRSGEKDDAAFWIRMKDKFVLIRYFAVRDKEGNYRGVLEVSQEISGIQAITGERRLLDW
ncbi:MAG: DUF438 domain-containing protein [Bacteroidales bacterium]|nr:DUF438 domain-containing protein [Bacteroidales bacterium]